MRVLSTAVASLIAASVAVANASEAKVNGWYPCGFSQPMQDISAPNFECAEVTVPLCHEGICKSDKNIELFVKRLMANATAAEGPKKAVWFLQGGPGASSAGMEMPMLKLHTHLKGEVSTFTVDHRGTGRSFPLECDAAQAFSGGSPSGANIGFEEFPNCIKDVLFQMDNQAAAISVTSAATDVKYLASTLNAEEEVYVYGGSYGTYLTERVMHLAPKNVKGYIIDGVVPEDQPSFTTTNPDRVPPAKEMAKICQADPDCAAMFKDFTGEDGDIHNAWKALYASFDKLEKGTNACLDMLWSEGDSASMSVKFAVSSAVASPNIINVPVVLHLIHRCQDGDVDNINQLLGRQSAPAPATREGEAEGETPAPEAENDGETPAPAPAPQTPPVMTFDMVSESSPLLANAIKASEMWVLPSPSWEDEKKIMEAEVFPANMAGDYISVCLFRGDLSDPLCNSFKEYAEATKLDLTNFNTTPFFYERDQYFGKYAKIPEGNAALVINGKLDFQTVSDGGVREFENLEGGDKMMVEFDFGGHCAGVGAYAVEEKSECGFQIMASFVAKSGKVEEVDTSCMDQLPELKFRNPQTMGGEETPAPEAPEVDGRKKKTATHKHSHAKKHHAKKHHAKVHIHKHK